MKSQYIPLSLEMMIIHVLSPDTPPATNKEGVVRTDDKGIPLYRVRVIANEAGRDFDVPVSLWIRRLPSRTVARGEMVQPDGKVTVSPWVSDRTHRLSYSIVADSIVPDQVMANRHQEAEDE